MSKIHTALKESAASARDSAVPAQPALSLLDEKLIEAGVPLDILTEANAARGKNGGFFDFLLKKKAIGEASLLKIMARHFGLPLRQQLPMESISIDFTQTLSIQYLKKHKLIPLITEEEAVIAVNDPSNFQPVDDLRQLLKNPGLQVVLAPQDAIMAAINMAYDMSRASAKDYFEEMNESATDDLISKIDETTDLLDETSDAPIIKLVNLILSGALKDRASDIHVEPYSGNLKIRYRIDGILYDILSLPRRIESPLVSRIKIMAKLNIAEKRLPQDGRIEIKIADRLVDIRVSIIPTAFGERVVLRLLDKTANILMLSDLGMHDERIRHLNKLIKSPYGIILVTGPTGSGKTTTLYAALSTINRPEINIITIEDPIEYQMDGVGQIQVNPKIDLKIGRAHV